MIMRVETMYSVYEIDLGHLRVRRVTGKHDPTPYQGPDGEWKSASEIHRALGGYLFVWPDGTSTHTSIIQAETDLESETP